MAGTEEEEERWHHLRVVRQAVPSGGTAGRREKNEKTEETCGKSDASGGKNASARMRTLTPAGPRDPRRRERGVSWDPPAPRTQRSAPESL